MIPADALGGALRDLLPGNYGILVCRKCGGTRIRLTCSYCGDSTFDHECNDGCRDCGGAPVRMLDCADRHVQHAIADHLRSLNHEVRVLLPRALGGEQGETVEETACPRSGHLTLAASGSDCPDCDGTGKIRRTVPAAEASAKLLAASVAGVVAGRGVVQGVLSAWDEGFGVRWNDRGSMIAFADDPLDDIAPVPGARKGWMIRLPQSAEPLASGPETGPAGRAAADAAALALGWALLDPSAPSGVRVPTWGRE